MHLHYYLTHEEYHDDIIKIFLSYIEINNSLKQINKI